jgi:predicted membrane-bound spermidine synthase
VSATLVVGAFLLGLGIGSLMAGALADRWSSRRALRAFALCELAIGAYGLLSRWLFYDVPTTLLAGPAPDRLVVFALIVAGLLIPTVLMGMSLPLLARVVARALDGAARRIGWLYAINTLGAGLGAGLGGLFVIGTVGYVAGLVVAALLNLLIALCALAAARRVPADDARRVRVAANGGGNARQLWTWCALVFASGFMIISLEIIWFRTLGLLLQSRSFAFALILGVFLIGDAIGIAIGARWAPRLADPKRFFFWLQGVVALYALAALWLVYAAHDWSAVQAMFTGRNETTTMMVYLAALLLLGITVLPPAILLGLSFPITQQAVQIDAAAIGFRVGLVQLANIVGNAAGSLVTGLVLLDLVGTTGALRIVAALGCAFVLALAFEAVPGRRRALAVAAALAVMLLDFPDGARWWSRLHGAPGIAAEDRTGVVFMAEGPDRARMYIGGHNQSTVPFLPIHGVLGVLGPLAHPDPRTVLVIGHGAGGTPFAAGAIRSIERVRVIEIVRPVYDVVDAFAATPAGSAMRRLLGDPRFERVVADGRHALFTSDARYDVIQADAIYPRSSHSGLLYSVEFFRQVGDRLAPGGLFVQWSPTPRTEASLRAALPHVVRVGAVLIGSRDPIALDRETLLSRIETPEVADYLRAGGWRMRDLLQLLSGPVEVLARASDQEDVSTDLFPKDEYAFSGPKYEFFPFRRFAK